MMDAPIRVGVLGCAAIARRSLLPAFASHREYQVTAVASRLPEKAIPLADQYACRAMSYGELVDSTEVDLIYVPLPTGLHAEWVGRCLSAGKHVLSEKSLATNLIEVEGLVAEAKNRNRFLMESFQFRFHAQNLRVLDLLRRGEVGKIRCIRVQFGFPPFPDGAANIRYRKELGGGALLDAGAYVVKAGTFLLGKDIQVIAATSWGDSSQEVDLGGTISFSRADGVTVQAAYGFDNYYQCGYEIWGQKGRIITNRAFTARAEYPAEVKIETTEGTRVEVFSDDHFFRLLNYVAKTLHSGDYSTEYEECLIQARLLAQAKDNL